MSHIHMQPSFKKKKKKKKKKKIQKRKKLESAVCLSRTSKRICVNGLQDSGVSYIGMSVRAREEKKWAR